MSEKNDSREWCEWNPKMNRLAYDADEFHGYATMNVGTGRHNMHLCESCSLLPIFKRMKKTPLRRAPSRK